MAERENYYLALELDPSIDDWATIEARITEKKREWAKLKLSGDPSKKRRVAQLLSEIGDIQRILKEPDSRREEAREGKRRLTERRRADMKRLDEQIEILRADGTYTDVDADLVTRQLGGSLTRAEIVKRFDAAGLRRRDSAGTAGPAPRPELLEPTVEKSIRDNLDFLGLADLYAFLDRPSHSSPDELCRRTDEIYGELMRTGKTDSTAAARSELTGLCKRVFAGVKEKAKYDATLAIQVMAELKPALELAGRRDGFLSQHSLDVLMRQAMQRRVRREDAERFIRDYAANRHWGVQRAPTGTMEARRHCGYCGTEASATADTTCRGCGEPLASNCPRCGKTVASSDAACPSCGCHMGDVPLVRALMRDGRALVAGGDADGARRVFARILAIWPGWKDATDALEQMKALERALTEQIGVLDALVGAGKLLEARRRMEGIARDFGRDALAVNSLGQRISEGLATAARLVRQGHDLQAAGKTEEALAAYTRALAVQADNADAAAGLERCPPPAPCDLTATVVNGRVTLSWTAAGPDLAYRVLRTEGARPTGLESGRELATTRTTVFDDTAPPVGIPVFYGVVTLRGLVGSPAPAISGPHLVTAEVEELQVQSGDGQVTLSWRPPPGAVVVEVRRAAKGAGGPGTPLPVSGNSCIDTGAVSGTAWTYHVKAVFPDPARNGARIITPGLVRTVTPTAPPPPVRDLRASRDGSHFTLTWTPPDQGAVQLFLCSPQTTASPGQFMDPVHAGKLGRPIAALAPGKAQVTMTTTEAMVVPVTVAGSAGVIGSGLLLSMLDPVSNLVSRCLGQKVVLTWNWPTGGERVTIAYRHDRYPAAPDETGATMVVSPRAEYERNGCWERRIPEPKPLYIAVWVVGAGSASRSPPAQCLEMMGHQAEVHYQVVSRRSILTPWRREPMIELTSADCPRLDGLILMGKPNNLPLSARDGVVIATIPHVELESGSALLPVPVPAGQGMHLRLFFENTAHAERIRLIHGDKHKMRFD